MRERAVFAFFIMLVAALFLFLAFSPIAQNLALSAALPGGKETSSNSNSGPAALPQDRPSWKNYPYQDGAFTFPRDEGAHSGTTAEWWYVNALLIDNRGIGGQSGRDAKDGTDDKANIDGKDGAPDKDRIASTEGARYHLMVSFFKRGTMSASILDERTGIYYNYSQEFDDAVQKTGELDIRYGESSLRQIAGEPFMYHLILSTPAFCADLLLDAEKKPLLANDVGIIHTGTGDSYYYALTNLSTSGVLKINGVSFNASGSGWMDRQWGFWNALRGWDWFSIKLDGNVQMVVYKLYGMGNEATFTEFASVIDADGACHNFEMPKAGSVSEFVIDYNEYWHSANSGNLYSFGWNVTIPALGLSLNITPIKEGQELAYPSEAGWGGGGAGGSTAKSFWEGSCNVSGRMDGRSIAGTAFVETTRDHGRIDSDLVIKSIKIEQAPIGGYNAEIAIENNGGGSLRDVYVEILDGSPYDGGVVLEKYKITGFSNDTTVYSRINSDIKRSLFVIVDPDNLIAEKNERNNMVYAEI